MDKNEITNQQKINMLTKRYKQEMTRDQKKLLACNKTQIKNALLENESSIRRYYNATSDEMMKRRLALYFKNYPTEKVTFGIDSDNENNGMYTYYEKKNHVPVVKTPKCALRRGIQYKQSNNNLMQEPMMQDTSMITRHPKDALFKDREDLESLRSNSSLYTSSVTITTYSSNSNMTDVDNRTNDRWRKPPPQRKQLAPLRLSNINTTKSQNQGTSKFRSLSVSNLAATKSTSRKHKHDHDEDSNHALETIQTDPWSRREDATLHSDITMNMVQALERPQPIIRNPRSSSKKTRFADEKEEKLAYNLDTSSKKTPMSRLTSRPTPKPRARSSDSRRLRDTDSSSSSKYSQVFQVCDVDNVNRSLEVKDDRRIMKILHQYDCQAEILEKEAKAGSRKASIIYISGPDYNRLSWCVSRIDSVFPHWELQSQMRSLRMSDSCSKS